MRNNLVKFYQGLNEVCRRVGKNPDNVQVLFATKYLDCNGLMDFIKTYHDIYPGKELWIGENRVQDAMDKSKVINQISKSLAVNYKFIMIGTLQKNKINKALGIFDEIQSVDSFELAKEINERVGTDHYNNLGVLPFASPVSKKNVFPIFLEVNISGEQSKHGFNTEELDKSIKLIMDLEKIELKGLMTMTPYFDDLEKTRPIFKKLKQIADKYNLKTSMGMSHDWQIAVEEGSDIVRIGSAIFS